jgi:molybdopterin-guanine dinucleotide biosynthesis protein A
MQASGCVLTGGLSSRMGRDKALLAYRGTTLAGHVARMVASAAGSVALIGDPDRYRPLGYPVFRDLFPGCGPLGGIHTALTVAPTDWTLVVACDMPEVTADALRVLLDRDARPGCGAVLATGASGEPEPLCGVYHRRCLPVLARAIREKRLKMRDLVPELDAELRKLDPGVLANVNTPADWAAFEEEAR